MMQPRPFGALIPSLRAIMQRTKTAGHTVLLCKSAGTDIAYSKAKRNAALLNLANGGEGHKTTTSTITRMRSRG